MAQVAQSIIIVANQILDLTAIGEIVIAADDVGELAGIIEEASALKHDFVQLHNQVVLLFDLNTAPDTRSGLDARIQEMKSLMYDIRVYAIKTQSLVWTIQRTIAHINSLVLFQSSIDRFYGLCSPIPESRFRCQARGSYHGKIPRHTDQRGALFTTTCDFFWHSGGS